MDIHEYQAKEILKKYHIPIPSFYVATNEAEIKKGIETLHLKEAVIKIQVHAGGRGKAGGVKFAKGISEIKKTAKSLLGMKLVNGQTGPQGVVAHRVLLSAPIDIHKEFYLGATIDRERKRAILIATSEGGMDIEELAKHSPEKLLILPIQLGGNLRPFHLLRLVKFMGWKGEIAKTGSHIAEQVAKAFIQTDASLLEINPLVLSKDQKLWALDAKLSIDDNALFRHKEFLELDDPSQRPEGEVRAKKFDLSYIALGGNIGCMVNGAGLAMATMDIIEYYGGKPANFLDVGGSASKEKVAEGFRIILSDPQVKVILVNIFGGIMNCALLAEGIVYAMKDTALRVPLVIRMEGTNVEMGKKILQDSSLPITTADSLEEAAKRSVDFLH